MLFGEYTLASRPEASGWHACIFRELERARARAALSARSAHIGDDASSASASASLSWPPSGLGSGGATVRPAEGLKKRRIVSGCWVRVVSVCLVVALETVTRSHAGSFVVVTGGGSRARCLAIACSKSVQHNENITTRSERASSVCRL